MWVTKITDPTAFPHTTALRVPAVAGCWVWVGPIVPEPLSVFYPQELSTGSPRVHPSQPSKPVLHSNLFLQCLPPLLRRKPPSGSQEDLSKGESLSEIQGPTESFGGNRRCGRFATLSLQRRGKPHGFLFVGQLTALPTDENILLQALLPFF